MNFTQCEVSDTTSMPKPNSHFFLSSTSNDYSLLFNSFDGVLFKKNLFALIKKGYIVSILQNNSAVLVNIIDKVVLDIV